MRYAKNGESYYAGDGLNKAPSAGASVPLVSDKIASILYK